MEIKDLTELASLIEKHLLGKLSSSEQQRLEEWLACSEENQHLFRRICSEKFIEQWRTEELLFNSEEAWEQFAGKMKPLPAKKRVLRYVSYVAAMIIVLLGISVALWNTRFSTDLSEIADLKPGSSMAKLTLHDGRIIVFTGEGRDTIQEEGIQLLAFGKGIAYKAEQGVTWERYNELEVPRKGEFFLLLSDGTKVWINSETHMRYPVVFDSTERVVEIEGEAYFEVQKDLTRPFKVKMKRQGIVEVTGTSFNVQNYRDEALTQVTLEEGRVRLWAGKESLDLKPGEQGYWRTGGSLAKKEVNTSLYTEWKNGRFVFKEQPLEEIMRTIARWYDVQVEFADENVRQVTFSGNLRRYDDFDKIIKMLEAIKVARFEVVNNKIRVFAYK